MAKGSEEYWREREETQRQHNIHDEKQYNAEIRKIYQRMEDEIRKEINGFYGKYAAKEGITIEEARRRVSKLDMEEYSRKAKEYVANRDLSPQANEEMRLYNLTMKVNRLEMLKATIGVDMVGGFDDLEKLMGQKLTEKALDEMERQAGILGRTVQNNEEMAHAIVNASFHNAKFSDRIWMYQDMLKGELDQLLSTGLIQGKHPTELARHLHKFFGVSRYDAERLMRTEMARVQTEAQKQSLLANGFQEYEFITVGYAACPICAALDEKHFKLREMQPGRNAPPMHPNCRCSIAAWMDEDVYNQWLDSGAAKEGVTFEEFKANSLALNYETIPGAKNYNYNGRSDIINIKEFSSKYPNIRFDDELIGWDIEKLKRQADHAEYKGDVDEQQRIEDKIRRIQKGYLKRYKENVLNDFLTGVTDMLERFPQLYTDGWLKSIRYDESDRGALAFVYSGDPNIYIHKRLAFPRNQKEARVAGYHEAAHILENMLGVDNNEEVAKTVVGDAFRIIGMRRQSRDAQMLCAQVARYNNKDNPYEIIAHSLDRNYTGNGNDFTRAIETALLQRLSND